MLEVTAAVNLIATRLSTVANLATAKPHQRNCAGTQEIIVISLQVSSYILKQKD
jgi:hypothetical protein